MYRVEPSQEVGQPSATYKIETLALGPERVVVEAEGEGMSETVRPKETGRNRAKTIDLRRRGRGDEDKYKSWP